MWQASLVSQAPNRSVIHPNRVHIGQDTAVETLARSLHEHMTFVAGRGVLPVVVCIGTDRSTGDSLGPLIGTALQERLLPLAVYGTLEEPVHAANLNDVLERIGAQEPSRPLLAIDACLGRAESVGYVSVKQGPLRPGTGVNKRLPEVGDLHVIGIVNVGGFMEYFVLQNTRLSLVMRMANTITDAIEKCLQEYWLTATIGSLHTVPVRG